MPVVACRVPPRLDASIRPVLDSDPRSAPSCPPQWARIPAFSAGVVRDTGRPSRPPSSSRYVRRCRLLDACHSQARRGCRRAPQDRVRPHHPARPLQEVSSTEYAASCHIGIGTRSRRSGSDVGEVADRDLVIERMTLADRSRGRESSGSPWSGQSVAEIHRTGSSSRSVKPASLRAPAARMRRWAAYVRTWATTPP